MLFYLLSLLLASDGIPTLMLDDTYHEVTLNQTSEAVYWVQPSPKHATIIAVHEYGEGVISGFKKSVDDSDFVQISEQLAERSGSFGESRFPISDENPVLFKLKCNRDDCNFVLNYIHTDPVYRTSAVVGAFSLFVCLFLFVFSWTLFCGACRATRKR